MSKLRLCAIIGSGPGVGAAVARRFAVAGHRIAFFARKGAADEVAGIRNLACSRRAFALAQ